MITHWILSKIDWLIIERRYKKYQAGEISQADYFAPTPFELFHMTIGAHYFWWKAKRTVKKREKNHERS